MTFIVVPDKSSGNTFTEQMWDESIMGNLNSGLWVPIAHTRLASAAASIDFSSIPATFTHLLVAMSLRTTAAVLNSAVNLRMNGDTGSNYDEKWFIGTGATPSAGEQLAATAAQIGNAPGNSSTANRFGSLHLVVPRYAGTVAMKGAVSFFSNFRGEIGNDDTVGMMFAHWRSTAAVTQLTILPGSNNFQVDSTATLYGLGGL